MPRILPFTGEHLSTSLGLLLCCALSSANVAAGLTVSSLSLGKVVDQPQPEQGEYWVQVVAYKQPSTLAHLPTSPLLDHLRIVNDQSGLNRALLGPYPDFGSALGTKQAIEELGVKNLFIRFSAPPPATPPAVMASLDSEKITVQQSVHPNTPVELEIAVNDAEFQDYLARLEGRPSAVKQLETQEPVVQTVKVVEPRKRVSPDLRLSIGAGVSRHNGPQVSYFGDREPMPGMTAVPEFSNWSGYTAGTTGAADNQDVYLGVDFSADERRYDIAYRHSQSEGEQQLYKPSSDPTLFQPSFQPVWVDLSGRSTSLITGTSIYNNTIRQELSSDELQVALIEQQGAWRYRLGLGVRLTESTTRQIISRNIVPAELQKQTVENRYLGLVAGIGYSRVWSERVAGGVDVDINLYQLSSVLDGEQLLYDSYRIKRSKQTYEFNIEPYVELDLTPSLALRASAFYRYAEDYGYAKNPYCSRSYITDSIHPSCYDAAELGFGDVENYGASLKAIIKY